jgi:hypothetical protein
LARNEAAFSMPLRRSTGRVAWFVLAPLLAQDVQGGELVRQDGERRLGLDLDRVVVDLAHFLDVVDVALQVRAFAGGALEREHHVVGGERRAVVELHALAQLEAPDRGRGLLPGGGQRRRQAQVLVAADQWLEHVAGHGQLQRLVERVRVHRQRVALVGDAHRLRLRGGGQRDERRRGEDVFLHFMFLAPCWK